MTAFLEQQPAVGCEGGREGGARGCPRARLAAVSRVRLGDAAPAPWPACSAAQGSPNVYGEVFDVRKACRALRQSG
jgi:hypothetical protein